MAIAGRRHSCRQVIKGVNAGPEVTGPGIRVQPAEEVRHRGMARREIGETGVVPVERAEDLEPLDAPAGS